MTQDLLRISGYASLFGQTDLSGDNVKSGAFAASILALPNQRLPMLFGHDTSSPIGIWDRLFEDKTGLFVSGRILAGSGEASRVSNLIKESAVTGLSIGFRTKRSQPTLSGRDLFEIDLWEVSVVAFPMLRTARITQIDDPLTSHSVATNGANLYA